MSSIFFVCAKCNTSTGNIYTFVKCSKYNVRLHKRCIKPYLAIKTISDCCRLFFTSEVPAIKKRKRESAQLNNSLKNSKRTIGNKMSDNRANNTLSDQVALLSEISNNTQNDLLVQERSASYSQNSSPTLNNNSFNNNLLDLNSNYNSQSVPVSQSHSVHNLMQSSQVRFNQQNQQNQCAGLPFFQQQFGQSNVPGPAYNFQSFFQPQAPQFPQQSDQTFDFNRLNAFMNTMENFTIAYNNDRVDFSERLDRCLNLVPRVDAIDSRVNRLEMAYGVNKSSDVRISGIPNSINEDPYVIAAKVFNELGHRNSEIVFLKLENCSETGLVIDI